MIKLNFKTYPGFLLLGTLSLLMLLALYIFFLINKYDSSRIPNLRKVATEYRASLIDNYLSRRYKDNSILILGDSQVMGGLLPEKYIFSTLLDNSLGVNMLNLAFGDSRILDNTYVLDYAFKKGMKFNAITFNINQAHVKMYGFRRVDLDKRKSYLHGLYRDLKSFLFLVFIKDPTTKVPGKLQLHKYPGYFDMSGKNIQSYAEKLEIFIEAAKKLSKKVIIYSAPHSREAVIYNNANDIENLLSFDLSMKDICLKKKVSYFRPDIFESKYYYDIVHFNAKGHREMARLLERELKSP
jgi:hypothetical protein